MRRLAPTSISPSTTSHLRSLFRYGSRRPARGARPGAARGGQRAARAGAGPGGGGHRQDPGDHPSHRLRRRDRHLQPGRGAGRHVHHPGRRRDAHQAQEPRGRRGPGAHVPLRRAAAGALLLAQGVRRRAARAHRVQAAACSATRPGAPGCRTDQATLRDLAGEIEWAKVSNVRPDDYAAARGRARPHGRRPRPRDRRPRLRHLRGGQARAGPHGHGGRPALRRRAAGRGRAGRGAGAPAVQVVRRRRVPGRQPDPGGAARPVARAVATTCAWWATRPRRSTRSPAPTRRTSSTSRASTPAPPRSSWSATTGPRLRWSRRPTGC